MAITLDAFGDERALILGCQAGEQIALRSFYERFFAPVYRYVLASVGHHQDAEDIAADVFVKAFRNLDRFQVRSKPVTAWLFRIARNEVIDHYRRRGRRIAAASIGAQQIEHAGRYDPMEATGLVMDLAEAVRALREAQRDAVLLRLVAGLSTREAAETMKIPEGTLRSHLHHAIKALRAAMER
jgi:RNA polymerase sigma-70 factor (ECF subfamily)